MRQCSSQTGSNHRRLVAIFTLVAAAVVTSTSIAGAPRDSDADEAVAKSPALHQYRALRRMHAVSEKVNQEGWMEAWTELKGQTFRYEIVSERGSDTIRNKVLKSILEKEKELVASGEPGRSELTAANYEFAPDTQAPGCKYILITPKRKDSLLVDGRMVLSADDGDLLRVEGKLSKNPSVWTSLVNIVRR